MSEASVDLTTAPSGNAGVFFQFRGFTFRQHSSRGGPALPQEVVAGEGLRVSSQSEEEIDFPSAARALSLTVSSPGPFEVVSLPKGIQLFVGTKDGLPLHLDFGPLFSETGIVVRTFENALFLREMTVAFGDHADCG